MKIGFRMSLILTVIILIFTFNISLSEARHKNLPSAVVGTVYCDTCFQDNFSKTSHFISGALVGVECADENSSSRFRKEVKTNNHGEFKVDLPFTVTKDVAKIKKCSVKLITSSEPHCGVASRSTSSSFHLKSRNPVQHILSAGVFTFKPHKQPNFCNQQTLTIHTPLNLISNPENKTFPPLDEKYLPPLPTLPNLPPLPQLPPLPTLPGFPFFPPFSHPPPPSTLPPVFLSPPPSILPPVFLSPPPSIFSPFQFQPSPLLPSKETLP